MDFKDNLIAQQNMKPEYQDMERRQLQEQAEIEGELTAEQEDFMLEEYLERERLERESFDKIKDNPSTFEITIQRLRERRESEGWTAERYFREMETQAKIELDEYKRELELAYGID